MKPLTVFSSSSRLGLSSGGLAGLAVVTLIHVLAAGAWAIPLPATGIIDRQFPVFQWCPVETRNGALIEFTASSTAVTITFTADNFASDQFVANRFDNVVLVEKSAYEANHGPVTNFSGCYVDQGDAPSYTVTDPDHLAGPVFAELFDTDPSGHPQRTWTGGHFDGASTAPRETQVGTDEQGGSWAVGDEAEGDVAVSSVITVDGLQIGTDYVVVFWWYAQALGQLAVTVEEAPVVAAPSRSWGTLKAVYRR
jgi:hypothetical protein